MVLLGLCVSGSAAGWAQVPASVGPTASSTSKGSLHGAILDRSGQQCEGARVSLQFAAEPAPRAAISDSEGRYLFGDLPAGSFTLTIGAEGFTPKTIQSTLIAGQSLEEPPVQLLVNSSSQVEVTASPTEVAQEQLHIEEQQRTLGVIPNFFVVYDEHALPLSARQKFHLALSNELDPVTAASMGLAAGVEQGSKTYPSWGQGARGFSHRYGAAYADDAIGTMIGSALLPSLFHQDPRFFFKAEGTRSQRIWYAVRSELLCRGDNGKSQFNYSSWLGSFAAIGITRWLYPASSRDSFSVTLGSIALNKATGAAQNVFQELFSKKLNRRSPLAGSSQP
jgi:hypothetical protein